MKEMGEEYNRWNMFLFEIQKETSSKMYTPF